MLCFLSVDLVGWPAFGMLHSAVWLEHGLFECPRTRRHSRSASCNLGSLPWPCSCCMPGFLIFTLLFLNSLWFPFGPCFLTQENSLGGSCTPQSNWLMLQARLSFPVSLCHPAHAVHSIISARPTLSQSSRKAIRHWFASWDSFSCLPSVVFSFAFLSCFSLVELLVAFSFYESDVSFARLYCKKAVDSFIARWSSLSLALAKKARGVLLQDLQKVCQFDQGSLRGRKMGRKKRARERPQKANGQTYISVSQDKR